MRKSLVVMALMLMCSAINTIAQNKVITVSGRVVESDTKAPVEMATVQLLSLPDSTQAAGKVTNKNGWFSLPKVKAGKYVLRLSFVGYTTKNIPVTLSEKNTERNVGTIALETDAVMLKEAVITAEAPQVTAVEDTLMYNASAYRTPEGAMLEELVKKLPGAEIDDEGNVTINGKEVKKIMVDGKEFFGGDVKTGLKNLPVNMVEKLKTYDRKSDLARITGIDDGEEETVLDLKVKKGMNQGWFGNIDAAMGTEKRYLGNAILNRFVESTQISIIAGGNNVNDQGFSGGGGGPRWKRNEGLNATKTAGINFANETDKLETGGSVRYNYRNADVSSVSSTERFLQSGNSYSNTNSGAINRTTDFNADFRLEWKPDTLTNIIFRPNFTYGKTNNTSDSYSSTFNSDPYAVVDNPNNYLNFSNFGSSSEVEELNKIRVNAVNSHTHKLTKSIAANGTLQVNRKLNSRGRNITFRGTFGYTDNDNESYSESETRYYQLKNTAGLDSITYRNQYIVTPTQSYSYSAQVTYSEPIAKQTFLQFSYNFQYKHNKSDKNTYGLGDDWVISDPLPSDYQASRLDSLCKYAEYNYYNHDVTTSLRFVRQKYQLSVGLSLQPQNSKLSYKKGDYTIDTTRTVFNFAPNIDFRFRFSKTSQLRFTYRGKNSQPSMENLLPIVDNSDPLRISMGNPGLKPAFAHNLRLFYTGYNADKQRGFMMHANFSATQNAIANCTTYNEQTGGTTTQPQNIDGNWNASGMFGFNTALPNRKYTINSFSRVAYTNSVAYLYDNMENKKNTSTELGLSERLNAAYRNDWFEFGINGSISYSFERNELRPANNQEPYTFSYGANTSITFPWTMTLSTNIANQSRRGYTDSSMNRNELIWNAQLSQSFFKGALTLTAEMYDILKQQSNISRSLTADMRSVSEYNAINSYCMFHVIYRLNIFGSKEARDKMDKMRGFGGPDGGPGRGGMGGPGGQGGGPGGFGGGNRGQRF
jgi:hypothetical protein